MILASTLNLAIVHNCGVMTPNPQVDPTSITWDDMNGPQMI